MTTNNSQERLFQDPLGQRLRLAREQKGLSCEQAARRLRIPTVIVEAMEREDWARLGAPIYVRSHVGAYLGLLELPATLVEQAANTHAAAPRLTAMASRSRLQAVVERGMRNAVYAVMTGVIVVPAFWLATHYDTRKKLVDAISLEADAIEASAPAAGTITELAAAPASPVASAGEAPAHRPAAPLDSAPEPMPQPAQASDTPVIASLAPFNHTDAAAADPVEAGTSASDVTPGLHLRFHGQSWLEVVTEDGRRIERDLVEAGSERTLPAGQSLRVTLGNADAVDVMQDSRQIDLAPFQSANVARFTVSSASEISPVGN